MKFLERKRALTGEKVEGAGKATSSSSSSAKHRAD